MHEYNRVFSCFIVACVVRMYLSKLWIAKNYIWASEHVKVWHRRIFSRVCYANMQLINQSLAVLTIEGIEAGSARHWNVDAALSRFALYVTRTEKGKRCGLSESVSCRRSTRPLSETATHRDWNTFRIVFY